MNDKLLQVVTLHNHFPLACLSGPCITSAVSTRLAHLQHYRQHTLTYMATLESPLLFYWTEFVLKYGSIGTTV